MGIIKCRQLQRDFLNRRSISKNALQFHRLENANQLLKFLTN